MALYAVSATPVKPKAATRNRRRNVETAAQRKTREAAEAKARMVIRRVGIVITAMVWASALWVSYFHITEVMIRYGQSQSAGHLYPIIVDGLMMIASVAIVAYPDTTTPKAIFLFGALATVIGNVLSVQGHSIIGYGGAGFTGASLIMSAYLLERLCLPHKPKGRR